MRPDPLAHVHDTPFFPSWPFAVAHQDLVTACVLLLLVAVGIALLMVAVAVIVWLSWFFYDLDRFFFPVVIRGNRGPLIDDPAAVERADRLEVAMRSQRRKAADLAAKRTSPAPEPPPASKSWLWLMPLADLWYERVVEKDSDQRREWPVSSQARALFDAWVTRTRSRSGAPYCRR
ncbi:hypothetical protein [Burkholderia vietnamiensis]|uniref:hypothetical protein n=1 Tax=Burkholderia vietnamiensis TaxID=60552 RepID=UPI001593EF23|nr:hypothetical protein [Burkholderia vietnamiensis]